MDVALAEMGQMESLSCNLSSSLICLLVMGYGLMSDGSSDVSLDFVGEVRFEICILGHSWKVMGGF